MGVSNSGGGGATVARGTAAARPGVPATDFYVATDTKELSIANAGAWLPLGKTSNGQFLSANDNGFKDSGNDLQLVSPNQNLVGFAGTGSIRLGSPLGTTAGTEAAAASAGAGAAPPATVQGYMIIKDQGGVNRKVPFYAN